MEYGRLIFFIHKYNPTNHSIGTSNNIPGSVTGLVPISTMKEGKCTDLGSGISGNTEVFLIASIRLLKYGDGQNSAVNSVSA